MTRAKKKLHYTAMTRAKKKLHMVDDFYIK